MRSEIPNSCVHKVVTHCLSYGASRVANYNLSYLYVRTRDNFSILIGDTLGFRKTTVNQNVTNHCQVSNNLRSLGSKLPEKDNITLIILQML